MPRASAGSTPKNAKAANGNGNGLPAPSPLPEARGPLQPVEQLLSGGSLSGTMNLIKSGSGTLTLNAANAFTGGTSITGGTT